MVACLLYKLNYRQTNKILYRFQIPADKCLGSLHHDQIDRVENKNWNNFFVQIRPLSMAVCNNLHIPEHVLAVHY